MLYQKKGWEEILFDGTQVFVEPDEPQSPKLYPFTSNTIGHNGMCISTKV